MFITGLAGIADTPFPGRSLDAVETTGTEEVAVSEVGRRSLVPKGWPRASGGLRSLQTERWQLIVSDAGPVELYDLENAPGQLHNLPSDPSVADVLAAMKRRLTLEVPLPASRSLHDGARDALAIGVPPADRR